LEKGYEYGLDKILLNFKSQLLTHLPA